MKRFARSFLLLLAVASGPAAIAQSALSVAPERCVYRRDDDPDGRLGWAAPDLDESAWRPIGKWRDERFNTPFWWMRCRLAPGRLAPEVDPVMQVAGNAAYEVYIDGERSGEAGNLHTGRYTMGMVTDWRSAAFRRRGSTVVVALRMTLSQMRYDRPALPAVSLGDERLQYGEQLRMLSQQVMSGWVTWTCYAFIAVAGAFFFALYWFDRSQHFLLYVGLTWLMLAVMRLNELLIAAGIHYSSQLELLLFALGTIQWVTVILFYYALMGRRLGWLARFFIGTSLIYSAGEFAAAFLPVQFSVPVAWIFDINPTTAVISLTAAVLGSLVPQQAFFPLRLLSREQILLYLACSSWMLMDFLYLGSTLPGMSAVSGRFAGIQPLRSVAILLTVVVLTLLLVNRIRRGNQQRATLEGEMQGARNIQQLLLPARVEAAPGWSIDAVCLPAREVGGDFYRCTLLPDGRQRILLGDVSGKGAAAAMTAALLLGAATDQEDSSPAVLLAHLNRVLLASGVGGMATCLCALLEPGGQVTLAQAGHLSPYLDGGEVISYSGLPLGLVAEVGFIEHRLEVWPGGRMTLLSDGVVEARNQAGELFGFDRAAAFSIQPAEAIAAAAQAFGQDDDITVLTLTRLADHGETASLRSAPALTPA